MKINKWYRFLTEDYNQIEPIINKSLAGNELTREEISSLQAYVRTEATKDRLGAGRAADGLVAYYMKKEREGDSNAGLSKRIYQKQAQVLKGLANVYRGGGIGTAGRAIDAFVGATNDPVVEKELFSSTDRPLFAKMIIDMSSWTRANIGIKVLDPTQAPTTPNLPWMRKYPKTAKVMQYLADTFASDPFTLLETLSGVTELASLAYGGYKGIQALRAFVKSHPERGAALLKSLSTNARSKISSGIANSAKYVKENKIEIAQAALEKTGSEVKNYMIDEIKDEIAGKIAGG